MTSFACDGPSVMLGKKNGVVAILKEDNTVKSESLKAVQMLGKFAQNFYVI